jgi:flagellar biosynthesis/type III secretory pathway chaperone
MNVSLADLAAILEQEIGIAEELERNLAAQKQAVIDWNMDGLLAQIEARALCLNRLDQWEKKRADCLAQAGFDDQAVSLRSLLAALPPNAPERDRLSVLGGNSKEIFRRLQADERHLHELMENLLAHIHGALSSLVPAASPTYGETGMAEPARPATTLLHGRA